MQNGVVHACHSVAEYHAILQSAEDRLLVVESYAPWCPPCRQMEPVFQKLATEYTDVVFVKVNVDQVPEIQRILGVWALPTFCFLRFGEKTGSFMGASIQKLHDGLENNGYVSFCSSCEIS